MITREHGRGAILGAWQEVSQLSEAAGYYTLKTLIETPLKRARSPSSFAMALLEAGQDHGGDIGEM